MRYETRRPPATVLAVEDSAAIGVYEAKTHLTRLVDEVEAGKSYVITRHGKAVARLVPTEPAANPVAVIAELRAFRRGRTLGAPARALIEEGRR